jgi:hypothetical protein
VTGATESFWQATIMVGTVMFGNDEPKLNGASPTAARMVGSALAEISEAPPPIEWPITPRRLPSTRPAIGLDALLLCEMT